MLIDKLRVCLPCFVEHSDRLEGELVVHRLKQAVIDDAYVEKGCTRHGLVPYSSHIRCISPDCHVSVRFAAYWLTI
jgi:hypothetical protein